MAKRKHVTVLRMEDDRRHGPFHPPFDATGFARAVDWIEEVPGGLRGDDEHPHHLDDVYGFDSHSDIALLHELLGIPVLKGDWLVGVKDLDQFYHWFPKDSLSYFSKKGFHLSFYDVPKTAVREGKFQNMFKRKSAKLIKTEELEKLA